MSEPLRATFFALQKREHGILLGATLCYLLIVAALTATFVIPFFAVMGIDLQAALSGATAQPPAPPNPMAALWILPLGLVAAFIFCVAAASFEAACLRWMIRGEKPGLFGLRLDADTWRVYGIYWVWFFCYLVALIGFVILSALLSRLLPENSFAWWIGIALYACAIGLAVVALAPAAAVSVAERRFAFGDAFQATENHYGSLLGSFALLVGLQWGVNYGLTAAWLVWALEGDVLRYFGGARDYLSFNVAYAQAVAAAMNAPHAAYAYWAITALSFVASFAISVLLYGVNARVARLALQEGTISATPAA